MQISICVLLLASLAHGVRTNEKTCANDVIAHGPPDAVSVEESDEDWVNMQDPGVVQKVSATPYNPKETQPCDAINTNRPAEIHLGPFSWKQGQSVQLVPQLKIGAAFKGFSGGAGIPDVRNGFGVELAVATGIECIAKANSLPEGHREILSQLAEVSMDVEKKQKAKLALEAGPEILQVAKENIAKKLGINAAFIEFLPESDVELEFKVVVSLGIEGYVRGGWPDRDGFGMIGVGGVLAAAINVGFDIAAGLHASKEWARIIIGIANFNVQYTVHIPQKWQPEKLPWE